jgi:hypothetical protein
MKQGIERDFRVTFASMDSQAIIGVDELAALLHRSPGAVAVLAHRNRLPPRAFPEERKLCWFVGDIRNWLAATRGAQLEPAGSATLTVPVDSERATAPRRIGRPRGVDQ